MKTVVVTGGTGFIGANLTRRLLGDGHTVHLLLRPESPRWRLEGLPGPIVLHEVSLSDTEALKRELGAIKPDWVFHLAAFGGSSWQTDKKLIVEANLLGTMNLLDVCMDTGFEAFINTGTSSEYGFKNHAPAETELLEPNSCYAIAKAGATHYCRNTAVSRKAHILTLRLYSAYGPFEQPQRLLPTLILNGIRGRFPPLVDPEVARDFIYIDDVVEAFIVAAKAKEIEPGGVFNIGTGVQTSMRRVAEIAQQIFQITTQPQWNAMPSRLWDTGVWVADNRKALSLLPWKPLVPFQEGLAKMARWFIDQPAIQKIYENFLKP